MTIFSQYVIDNSATRGEFSVCLFSRRRNRLILVINCGQAFEDLRFDVSLVTAGGFARVEVFRFGAHRVAKMFNGSFTATADQIYGQQYQDKQGD